MNVHVPGSNIHVQNVICISNEQQSIFSSNVDPGDHQAFSKGEQVLYLASFPTSNIFFFQFNKFSIKTSNRKFISFTYHKK